MTVLDASAALAFLFREPGHERVAEIVNDSRMSTVNLAEVLSRFTRDGHAVAVVWARLRRSPIEWVPLAESHATVAAELAPFTMPYGLSLGDRACLALAIERGLPVLTADRAWAGLGLPVEVRLIR